MLNHLDGDYLSLTCSTPEQQARVDEFSRCGIDPQRIPVRSILPLRVGLPIGERLCYMLDLSRITSAQRCALVVHLAQKFGLDTTYVESTLDQWGVPILAENATTVSTQPWKYL